MEIFQKGRKQRKKLLLANSPFPKCFHKTCMADMQNMSLFGKGLIHSFSTKIISLYQTVKIKFNYYDKLTYDKKNQQHFDC